MARQEAIIIVLEKFVGESVSLFLIYYTKGLQKGWLMSKTIYINQSHISKPSYE